MPDKYSSFEQLTTSESSDAYQISCEFRRSAVAIVAPHAGKIEPGTSEICREIAGRELTFYLFEGCKSSANSDLHITSTRFDEPIALKVISDADTVVTIHGQSGDEMFVNVGGLDQMLGNKIIESLTAFGCAAGRRSEPHLQGRDPLNICNKGNSGSGVQLEISRALRDQLRLNYADLVSFSEAIRSVLLSPESNIL
ncbi:MAG: replication protein [Lysobacter sp.]|nr:MAG: replication protein [Lysobacter sp.]